MCDTNNIVDSIGYSGGVVLSVCLIPQIYTIYKSKEVENISYIWQIMYIIGISLHLYYAIYYNLLPIYVPTIVELFLILILLRFKIIYRKKKSNDQRLDI